MGVFTRHFLKRVLYMGLLVAVYLAVSATIFHWLENWTWPQALYFCAVTLTSVGYGDMHPTTDLSRLVTTAFVLFSVPMFFLMLGVVGEAAYLHYRGSAHHHVHSHIEEPKPRAKAKRKTTHASTH